MINLCFFLKLLQLDWIFSGWWQQYLAPSHFHQVQLCLDKHIFTGHLNDFEIWSHCGQTVAAANQLELWPVKGQCRWREPNKYLPWVFPFYKRLLHTNWHFRNHLKPAGNLLETHTWGLHVIICVDHVLGSVHIHLLVTKETHFQFLWNFL